MSNVNARSACRDDTDCLGEELNKVADSVERQLNTGYIFIVSSPYVEVKTDTHWAQREA